MIQNHCNQFTPCYTGISGFKCSIITSLTRDHLRLQRTCNSRDDLKKSFFFSFIWSAHISSPFSVVSGVAVVRSIWCVDVLMFTFFMESSYWLGSWLRLKSQRQTDAARWFFKICCSPCLIKTWFFHLCSCLTE